MKNYITYGFISVVCLLQISCNESKPKTESNGISVKGDTILVADSSNLKSKMKIGKVEKRAYQLQITSAATVKAIPNKYAQIAPPFSGRIIKSYVRLGQRVEQGSPLFELISPGFIDAQKSFFQAKSQYKLSEQSLKRQKDLLQHGVGVQKDLEEAENNFEVQKKEYENSLAAINIYTVDHESLALGQPLVVRSPIKGEMIVNNIVVGQFLRSDTEPVAVVAELSKVWVTGMVKEKDIRFIEEKDKVEIELIAYPGETIVGHVFHISQQVDESTRAIEVYVECVNINDINKHQKLKPGMYATVKFIEAPKEVIMVPAQAVMQKENKNFVFVQVAPDKFLKKYIETGNTENGNLIVTAGLVPGDVIILEGGFYLLDAK